MKDGIAGQLTQDYPKLLVVELGAALLGHPTEAWLVATPDFLAVAAYPHQDEPNVLGPPVVEPVECKSDKGGAGWDRPGTDQVPPHHRVQLPIRCEILGSPRGWLVGEKHAGGAPC